MSRSAVQGCWWPNCKNSLCLGKLNSHLYIFSIQLKAELFGKLYFSSKTVSFVTLIRTEKFRHSPCDRNHFLHQDITQLRVLSCKSADQFDAFHHPAVKGMLLSLLYFSRVNWYTDIIHLLLVLLTISLTVGCWLSINGDTIIMDNFSDWKRPCHLDQHVNSNTPHHGFP